MGVVSEKYHIILHGSYLRRGHYRFLRQFRVNPQRMVERMVVTGDRETTFAGSEKSKSAGGRKTSSTGKEDSQN